MPDRLALLAACCAATLAATPALADVLVGDRIAVGINDDGSLCESDVGLLYDPDGTEGDTPLGSDLLLPGRDFEVWGATWTTAAGAQSVTAGQPFISGGPDVDWDDPVVGRDVLWQEGQLALPGLDVDLAVDLPIEGDVLFLSFELTAREDVTDLVLVRTVDSDPDYFATGGYGTANRADGDVVVAGSFRDGGKALALGVDGGTAAVCRSWCTTSAEVLAGETGTLDGDRVIGVVSPAVDLAAGESTMVRFAYGLATDATTALDRARDAIVSDDLDGDGVSPESGDCDDRDSTVAGGLPEVADGLDNDCDGTVDEDTPISDDDGDGFAEVDGDCDDSDDRVHPGADPVDGVADADCDGLADDDNFRDEDRPDGWGLEDVQAGCHTAPLPAGLALLILPLLVLRRRR